MNDHLASKGASAVILLFCIVAGALCILVAGCTSMTGSEKIYVASAAIDLTSTAYGLERGLGEANGIMTLSGDDTASVLLSGIAVKTGFFYLFRWVEKRTGSKLPFQITSGIQLAIALKNLAEIAEFEDADQRP